ncbi:MAG: heparinase II/III family protein [Clostridia bacterium]|nr:heparinase II/III family protein [Clostridia bacterium]
MFGPFLDVHPLREMIDTLPVCPFPVMQDRAAWAGVSEEDRADLLELYAQLKDVPYPMCTASQFMAFVTTGSRKAYENPYFLRRRKLIASVMHMCLTGGQEALYDVIDGVWCLLEESTWVISAHNVNPIPGALKPADKPLPEMDDRYIDLFAAQTAMILALTDCLVGDALDVAAPVVRRRLRRELEERIFTPFMVHDDFWWMGFIRRDLCNWTPWIISNILLTASVEMQDTLRFSRLAERACRMLDRWLAVIPQDGGCDEGTAYYNMAGGALLDCLELLEHVTQGRMVFWQEEKIRNILSFPVKTQLPNGWFVNFADCDAKPFLCGERLQLAGEKLNDPALIALGMAHRGTPSRQIADVPHFTRLLARLFHAPELMASAQIGRRDVYLPDLQLRVAEQCGMILCAKGGHNGESHNHNDVGSFMLYVDGEPEIIDLGNMTYTAKTFSDARYTLFNTRSAYHNLPMIGGCEQRAGEAFGAARVMRLEDGLALDIAGAYGEDAGVVCCERRLQLTAALTLCDRICLKSAQPVTWVFMLRHAPALAQGCAAAGHIRIGFDPRLAAAVEEIPVSDARMAKNYPGSVWRLMLTADAADAFEETFTIERVDTHE